MKKLISTKMEVEMMKLLDEAGQMEDKKSEDYKTIMDRVDTLNMIIAKQYEVDVELDKNIIENTKVKNDDLDSKRNSKREYILGTIKTGVEVAAVVVPIVFYSAWMNKGFEFEKEGTFTSTTFKGLFGKFKPTK